MFETLRSLGMTPPLEREVSHWSTKLAFHWSTKLAFPPSKKVTTTNMAGIRGEASFFFPFQLTNYDLLPKHQSNLDEGRGRIH